MSSSTISRQSASVNAIEEEISSTQLSILSEESSLLYNTRPPKQKCVISYRLRKISSKGAMLVLIWVLLVNAGTGSPNSEHQILSGLIVTGRQDVSTFISYFLPLLSWLLTVVVAGWLADTRIGTYRTTKLGLILLFVSSILNCAVTVVHANFDNPEVYSLWYEIVMTLPKCLMYMGNAMVVVTAIQLGLDQMPDASSGNISSYISWYGVVFFTALWTNNCLHELLVHCGGKIYIPIFGLFPVASLCTVLCSMYILSDRWLIKEPNCPLSVKKIYQVLRFAAKHKIPINRSAFTYWEDNIPSRLDLGKSRFGGPFTIEEVEDVKTIFRLLVVFIPAWIVIFSCNIFGSLYLLTNPIEVPGINTSCFIHVFSKFTYNPWWSCIIAVVLYEIYMIFRTTYKLPEQIPSILQQITLLLFLLCVCIVVFTIISFVDVHGRFHPWSDFVFTMMSFSLFGVLTVCIIEFVCAQSPYNMRGLFSGLAVISLFLFAFCGYALSLVFTKICAIGEHCQIVQYVN